MTLSSELGQGWPLKTVTICNRSLPRPSDRGGVVLILNPLGVAHRCGLQPQRKFGWRNIFRPLVPLRVSFDEKHLRNQSGILSGCAFLPICFQLCRDHTTMW
jgi:hypothetical protein